MTTGWFVFTMTACIVLCSGFFVATAILRSSWTQREKGELTAEDLRVLEESALCLIEDLKSEVDRGIEELDKRSAVLRGLLAEADRTLNALRGLGAASENPMMISDDAVPCVALADRTRVLELASSGLDCAQIARVTGIDCAEVKLLLNINKLPV